MPRIVVIGAGLLGGSLLASLQTRRGTAADRYTLVAVSSAGTRAALRGRDWCDALFDYEQIADACDGADLVLLCTPLASIRTHIDAIAACANRLATDAIVTDVGSTKGDICQHGFLAFPDRGAGSARFVGGHPMAGSERSGLDASDPLLYQSALWVLCPPPGLAPDRLDPLRALVAATGARATLLDPVLHDTAVARVSHVPQVLASVLAGWAGAEDRTAEAALALAAGGFRDMTRLAVSSWGVWRDIVRTNAAPIAIGLQQLSEELARLAQAAAVFNVHDSGSDTASGATGSDGAAGELAFHDVFAAGRAFRERFHMPRKGIMNDLTELVVRLEDRPGQLLDMFMPLAAVGINVQDLEILKVREGETGTILLGFATPGDAARARDALNAAHFAVTEH